MEKSHFDAPPDDSQGPETTGTPPQVPTASSGQKTTFPLWLAQEIKAVSEITIFGEAYPESGPHHPVLVRNVYPEDLLLETKKLSIFFSQRPEPLSPPRQD